ncbi:MAG: GtrA family protein [Gammaproteobacteria bacterium]
MISRERFNELARFAVTGAVCASLNVLISILLTEYLGLHYLVSLTICSCAVIVTGFFLNRSWTFRKSGPEIVAEFGRYSLATSVNMVVGICACALLVEELHLPYAYAIAIVAIAFAPMTYVVHRVWTFGLSWIQSR